MMQYLHKKFMLYIEQKFYTKQNLPGLNRTYSKADVYQDITVVKMLVSIGVFHF